MRCGRHFRHVTCVVGFAGTALRVADPRGWSVGWKRPSQASMRSTLDRRLAPASLTSRRLVSRCKYGQVLPMIAGCDFESSMPVATPSSKACCKRVGEASKLSKDLRSTTFLPRAKTQHAVAGKSTDPRPTLAARHGKRSSHSAHIGATARAQYSCDRPCRAWICAQAWIGRVARASWNQRPMPWSGQTSTSSRHTTAALSLCEAEFVDVIPGAGQGLVFQALLHYPGIDIPLRALTRAPHWELVHN